MKAEVIVTIAFIIMVILRMSIFVLFERAKIEEEQTLPEPPIAIVIESGSITNDI